MRVAGIYYPLVSAAVNDGDDIALQVMDIAVPGAVEGDNGRPALGILEEVQVIASLREMRDPLAVEGAIRRRAVYGLAHAQDV